MPDPDRLRAGDLLDDEPPRRNYYGLLLLLLPVLFVAGLVTMGVMGDPFLSDIPGGLGPGEPLPEIKAAGWINGAGPTDAELRGKVLVVDAWASWCQPCRDEAPHLVELHERFGKQGVVFIGLTSEPKKSLRDVNRYLEHFGITWLNGYGAEETLGALGAEMIPMMWVAGPDGRVVWNRSSREPIEAGITKALAMIK